MIVWSTTETCWCLSLCDKIHFTKALSFVRVLHTIYYECYIISKTYIYIYIYTVIGFYIDCRWCFVFINSHCRHVDVVNDVKFGSVKVMRTWMTFCVFVSVIANLIMTATA